MMRDVLRILDRIRRLLWVVTLFLFGEVALLVFNSGSPDAPLSQPPSTASRIVRLVSERSDRWHPPDSSEIPPGETGALIRYGRELTNHTALYLGPNGKVWPISNGLSCQNCHLWGGGKAFAANYSAVGSTYPRLRKRSGRFEGFEKRVNDCFRRSLNGTGLPRDSREMKAIIAYMKWIGKEVPRGTIPHGAGLVTLPFLKRPADPVQGKAAYLKYCSHCHGKNGQGVKAENKIEWKYPPLWGLHSYNTAAGLFRVSKFAAFIKANMPYGATFDNPVLTDEEAWDIAAFVNSMPRPHRVFAGDWPDVTQKPVDHPFGPYADGFTEAEHKYGPYNPILKARAR